MEAAMSVDSLIVVLLLAVTAIIGPVLWLKRHKGLAKALQNAFFIGAIAAPLIRNLRATFGLKPRIILAAMKARRRR
jgi:hypothetical protein